MIQIERALKTQTHIFPLKSKSHAGKTLTLIQSPVCGTLTKKETVVIYQCRRGCDVIHISGQRERETEGEQGGSRAPINCIIAKPACLLPPVFSSPRVCLQSLPPTRLFQFHSWWGFSVDIVRMLSIFQHTERLDR